MLEKLVIIGHSWALQLGDWLSVNNPVKGSVIPLNVVIEHVETLTRCIDDDVVKKVRCHSPDAIMFILGGNDIVKDVQITQLKIHITKIINAARALFPHAKLYWATLEERHYMGEHPKNGLSAKRYNSIAQIVNRWLSRMRTKLGLTAMFLTRGKQALQKKHYSHDDIHLSHFGYVHFVRMLKKFIISKNTPSIDAS